MDLESANRALAEVYRGKRWIVANEVSAGTSEHLTQLDAWGAEAVLPIAGGLGVGDQPDRDVVYTGVESTDTMMEAIRAFFRSITEPSDEVVEAVETFDPTGEALVTIPDVHSATTIFGRPTYGSRSAAAHELEDKMLVDELWDAAAVPRSQSEIVPVVEAPSAARHLANEHGTVWVADNTLGWHGGANYTRWIPSERESHEAVSWFGERAQRVRVMPFLDGIPCSIHGLVTRTGVAAFRPVEMLTLRRTDRPAFLYGGVATYWDPEPADRAEMREIARRVGDLLNERVGYLGPFSVDGVMTIEGFRPTELNPRMSAGLGRLASTVEGLHLSTMVRALREGDLEIDAGWLEDLIVSSSDETRTGGAYTVVQGRPFPAEHRDDTMIPVVYEDGRLRRTTGDEEADGTITGGDNAAGAFVRVSPDPERVAAGPSLAPMGVALVTFIAEEWGLEVGDVAAAPDVRRAALSGEAVSGTAQG